MRQQILKINALGIKKYYEVLNPQSLKYYVPEGTVIPIEISMEEEAKLSSEFQGLVGDNNYVAYMAFKSRLFKDGEFEEWKSWDFYPMMESAFNHLVDKYGIQRVTVYYTLSVVRKEDIPENYIERSGSLAERHSNRVKSEWRDEYITLTKK